MSHTLILNATGLPISVIPLSVFEWEDAIKATYIKSVSILEEYEDWVVSSPSIKMHVPSVVMTKRYINEGKNIRFTRENLFLRDSYCCQYCSKSFPEGLLTLDHVNPISFGGKSTWSNLVAACRLCNHSRGNNIKIRPMISPYRPTYYEMVDRRRQFPIVIPHKSWLQYLDWPKENIIMKPHKKIDIKF